VRVLVISDVHGNLAALEAVLAQPHDALVCLGDVVGYGPEPGACARRIRAEAALVLQGNHDRALGEGVPPGCSPRFEWLARALEAAGRAQLDPEERAWLVGLPPTAIREYDGRRCFLVHATPGDPLYRYLGPDAPEWADEVAGLDLDTLLVGHTHVQFERTAAGRRVINPGSVGQPKDGDPRAACAILENGAVRLERVPYDVERATAALARTGADSAAVAVLAELLRTGRVPP
jgi:predicted phosphodiesterase